MIVHAFNALLLICSVYYMFVMSCIFKQKKKVIQKLRAWEKLKKIYTCEEILMLILWCQYRTETQKGFLFVLKFEAIHKWINKTESKHMQLVGLG